MKTKNAKAETQCALSNGNTSNTTGIQTETSTSTADTSVSDSSNGISAYMNVIGASEEASGADFTESETDYLGFHHKVWREKVPESFSTGFISIPYYYDAEMTRRIPFLTRNWRIPGFFDRELFNLTQVYIHGIDCVGAENGLSMAIRKIYGAGCNYRLDRHEWDLEHPFLRGITNDHLFEIGQLDDSCDPTPTRAFRTWMVIDGYSSTYSVEGSYPLLHRWT